MDLRSGLIKENTPEKAEWRRYNLPGDIEEPGEGGDPNECQTYDYVYQAGPLIQTEWGQGCVYNQLCPTELEIGCSNLPCNRALTGCVAVAVAQIMKFHEYPSNYNWNLMQNSYFPDLFHLPGENDVAQLMKDIGDAIGMNYSCDGSWVAPNKTDDAFAAFNYSQSGEFGSFLDKLETVKSNLRMSNPVILGGNRTANEGHAWVCDGYQIFQNSCETLLFFSMKWGFDGDYDDWYGIFDFSPTVEKNYQYDQKAIVNIQP